MSKYTEKFKDPRWQKKRLEILNENSFVCENCSAEDNTLHVHHLYYEKFLDPWDYPNSSLVALCEDCHKEWHKNKEKLDKAIGLRPDFILALCGYAKALYGVEPFECNTFEEEIGYADRFKTTQKAIERLSRNGEGVPLEFFLQENTLL